MTGAIPLEFLAEDDVDAVVLSQPTVPVFGKGKFGMPEEAVNASFSAINGSRRKRIISFNYLADRLTIGKTFAIAERFASPAVAGRHILYIGVLRDAVIDREKIPADLSGWHRLEVHDCKGHSTITATENPHDLLVFRTALFKELGLKMPQ
ncbi:MAG TPA: hypothetical protein VF258_07375 [Luteolibacter sp.]